MGNFKLNRIYYFDRQRKMSGRMVSENEEGVFIKVLETPGLSFFFYKKNSDGHLLIRNHDLTYLILKDEWDAVPEEERVLPEEESAYFDRDAGCFTYTNVYAFSNLEGIQSARSEPTTIPNNVEPLGINPLRNVSERNASHLQHHAEIQRYIQESMQRQAREHSEALMGGFGVDSGVWLQHPRGISLTRDENFPEV